MSELKKFYNFSLRAPSIPMGERCWFAHFKIEGDFSRLFPFIQATASEVEYFESPEYIRFRMENILFALYPPDTVVSKIFHGREHALEFAQKLIDYLNHLETHKTEIQPVLKKYTRLHVPELLNFLPITNCGECGFRTCMAFAGAVSRRRATLGLCPYFPGPVDTKIIFSVYDKNSQRVRKIEVDPILAGVAISKDHSSEKEIHTESDLKKKGKRMPGLIGDRDGIVFKISGREIEVLRLITEGFTNKEIARILKVSQNTVKSHVTHIFNKLGVNDRTQAAVWAAQNELI
jgi:DNA-binding CsgD family transcriptional regulator/ArsR family metal-binding transcriptional regulator